MKKRLKACGNGWLLVLTQPMQKLLGYNLKETKVLITAKDATLYIEPIKDDLEKYCDKMVRGFQKGGGSYGIYLPKILIEVLDIEPEYEFIDIKIDEDKMIIKKFNQ